MLVVAYIGMRRRGVSKRAVFCNTHAVSLTKTGQLLAERCVCDLPQFTIDTATTTNLNRTLTMMAVGVFLITSLLLGRPGPKVHCRVLAVSTANLLAPGVASAMGTFTSCGV